MSQGTTFRQRSSFLWPRVALGSTLTDDISPEEDGLALPSLREEASWEGLTYIQVMKHLEGTDLYLARVAPSPCLLAESDLLVYFTEEQLSSTLPVDVRLERKRPEEIIRAIKAHAAALLPACASIAPLSQTANAEIVPVALRPLAETIEVTPEDLTEALASVAAEQQEAPSRASAFPAQAKHLLQQAFLRVALDTLMRQLWQTPGKAYSLVAQARVKVLAALLRWQEQTRQRVVVARKLWKQAQGEVVWELTIGVPIQLR